MKWIVWLLTGCLCSVSVYAQEFGSYPEISASLAGMGMENVAAEKKEGVLRISYDDAVYRNNVKGLFDVIRMLLDHPQVDSRVHILLLEEQMPQALIRVPEDAIRRYRSGEYTLEDVMRSVNISHDTKTDVVELRKAKRENPSYGKVNIVLYPQVSLRNAWYDKLYGAVFNVAPAAEVGLWKGASLTGQVIFPIWNNMTGEMDYIRPGMLLFRQQTHLFSRLYTTFSIGNFNGSRMGVDVNTEYRSDNGRWITGARGGLTGSSTFYEGQWEVSYWKRGSGSAYVRYHWPRYDMDIDVAAHRYIFGDYGVRMDCSRHFGEVTVGGYAMYSGGQYNGGFHFAIPLFSHKQAKRRAVQIRLPKYFDWEYEAQVGREYAARKLGRYYETRPDDNRSQSYYNPDYMKSFLISLARSDD